MGFAYYSPISINAAQVPTTQTDFPVLVSQTDARFKTTGGHVLNSNGYDIRPYSDAALTSALTYELERYNSSTGEVIMWVKVGSLSSSTTPIYLAYGDASLNSDGSSTTTWSNSFISVYHFTNGTVLSVADSLNVNNGTNTLATASTGQIDGDAAFAGSAYVDIANPWAIQRTAYSVTAWVKPGSVTGNLYVANWRNSGDSNIWWQLDRSTTSYRFIVGDGTNLAVATATSTAAIGTWALLHGVRNGNNVSIYVNGVVSNASASLGNITVSSTPVIGAQSTDHNAKWNGDIDEHRIVSTNLSADWITTEYNNQSAPGTFETLGTEVGLGIPGLYTI